MCWDDSRFVAFLRRDSPKFGQLFSVKRDRGVLGSFGASSLAKALRALVRIGLLLIAARAFTLAEVGSFAFVMGVGTLVMGLLDLGVTSLLQREVSARKGSTAALERQALYIRLLTLPIGLAIAWGLAVTVAPGIHVSAIGTLAFTGGLATVDFTAGVQRARGAYRLESLEVGPIVLGCLAVGLGVVFLEGDFHAFQWSIGLAAGVFSAQRVGDLIRQLGISAADGREAVVALIWQARWFWVMTVGALVLFEAPLILLQELATEEDVALYATAMRAVGLGSQPLVVLAAVFVPSLAYEAEAREIYRGSVQSLNELFLLALPASFGLTIAGGIVFLAAAGPEYQRAIPILLILAIGTLIYVGAPNAGPLLVEGFEKPLGATVFIAAATTIALCAVLIPGSGAIGAALSAAGGLIAGKAGHAFLYRIAGLPFVTRLGLKAAPVILIWAVLLVILPTTWRVSLLSVGGLVSLAVTVRLMRNQRVFGSYEDSGHEQRPNRRPRDVKTRPEMNTIQRRSFEPETLLLRSLCKSDRLSLDIGASTGVYVRDMLRFSRRVHAFEPLPELADLLRVAFRHIPGRVVVHEIALSNTDGKAVLRIHDQSPGTSTIEPRNVLESSLRTSSDVTAVEVVQRRLDSLGLATTGFMRLNVEGHELEVLQGARELLTRDQPSLLVEVYRPCSAGDSWQVRRFLRGLGYRALWWQHGGLVEVPTDGCLPGHLRNIVFVADAEFQGVRDRLSATSH